MGGGGGGSETDTTSSLPLFWRQDDRCGNLSRSEGGGGETNPPVAEEGKGKEAGFIGTAKNDLSYEKMT